MGTTPNELQLNGALTKGSAGVFTLDITGSVSTTATNEVLITFTSTTFSLSDFKLELPANVTGTLAFNAGKTDLEIDNLVDPPAAGQELPAEALAPTVTQGDCIGVARRDRPAGIGLESLAKFVRRRCRRPAQKTASPAWLRPLVIRPSPPLPSLAPEVLALLGLATLLAPAAEAIKGRTGVMGLSPFRG